MTWPHVRASPSPLVGISGCVVGPTHQPPQIPGPGVASLRGTSSPRSTCPGQTSSRFPSASSFLVHQVVYPQPFYTDLTRSTCKTPLVVGAPDVADHWSTSVAWKRRVGGIVIPRAWAVFRLITSANVVGCWTGRSAGSAPLRSFPTEAAARRSCSARLTPYAMRPPACKTFRLAGVDAGRSRRDGPHPRVISRSSGHPALVRSAHLPPCPPSHANSNMGGW
jgi:hypothetical protein